MPRKVRLSADQLEARDVPAASVFGTPWPNAGGLTLSFAPDGTKIPQPGPGGVVQEYVNTLGAELNGAMTTAAWKEALLRAFQTWAVNTNLNLGLVPDGGVAFGNAQVPTGTAPGGDIRVGAYDQSPEVLAISQPFSPLTGRWAGDVLLNGTKAFTAGGGTGTQDLFTVMLHEAGNALGMADVADTTSARYGTYTAPRAGLNAADVTAVRAMYGTRTPDAYGNNDSINSQTVLTAYAAPADPTKKMVSAVGADLTTLTDVDHYEFVAPAGTTSLTLRLETVGKSLLRAKVSVYDGEDRLLTTATSAGPLAMQDLVLTMNTVRAGDEITIRVEKAANDVFGIGKYDLKVGFNFDPAAAAATTTVAYASDGGTNESLATATTLSAVSGSANKMYVKAGRIESATDADYYKITAPTATPAPLTVILDPAVAQSLYAKVTVYNATGAVVPSEVLSNGADGHYLLQVPNPVASQAYYLKVESVGRNGSGLTGDYTLTADFALPAVTQTALRAGTLTNTKKQEHVRLTVDENQVHHLTLGATTPNGSAVSGVRAVVFDAAHRIVATLAAEAGRVATGQVLLTAGTYTVRFEAATQTGVALPTLTYSLKSTVVSDPIDVFGSGDPTADPEVIVTPITDPPPDQLPDPWTDPWQP